MRLRTVFGILSLLTLTPNNNEAIHCQTNYPIRIISTSETFRTPTMVRPSLTTIVRDEKMKVKADACCGSRPFSTTASICCLGKTIRRDSRRCCISGPTTLRRSKCSCYPRSAWIRGEISKMSDIGERAVLLTEQAITAKEQLVIATREKETLVRKLDARASSLYLAFIHRIGVEQGEDPEEAQYIYEMITSLRSTEEGQLTERSKNEEESEKDIRLRRSLHGETEFNVLEQATKEAKIRLLNHLRRLLTQVKSGTYSLSQAVLKMKVLASQSALRSDLWEFGLKKQEVFTIPPPSEEEGEAREAEQLTEAIVTERNRLLKQIKQENFLIRESKRYIELLDTIYSSGNSQHKLIAQLVEILDETLGESMEIEDELMALEFEAEESEGGSFEIDISANRQSSNFAVETVNGELDPGCNITTWVNQRNDFSTAVQENFSQMKEILNFIATNLETNTRRSDQVPSPSRSTVERTS